MYKSLSYEKIYIVALLLLSSCGPHIDSIYLGKKESNFLSEVCRGDQIAVQDFLDNGGNINLQDEPGMTPLHHAVNEDWRGKNLEMIRLLIERGADVRALCDLHYTPLNLASNKEHAQLLIDAGADVNAKTRHTGKTLLFSATHGAAQAGDEAYLDLAKLLLAKGADPNVKLTAGSMIKDQQPHHSKSGETALHQVARSYYEKHACEVSELLIANGAKVNALNDLGQTPLDEALANGRMNTAQFLRNKGAQTGQSIY